ncbi:MAG: integration host factor subunit beta [Deltaproteobacteria bacterium]|nr:integration host factor subunit beta [Deltaproteobacteria bacterium]
MNKSDLIEALAERRKMTQKEADLVVNLVLDGMTDALRRGERIEIRGFGSLIVKTYDPYIGRNPKTGEQVQVPAKRLPFFKVGKELKERVDGRTSELTANGEGGDEMDDDDLTDEDVLDDGADEHADDDSSDPV